MHAKPGYVLRWLQFLESKEEIDLRLILWPGLNVSMQHLCTKSSSLSKAMIDFTFKTN